MPNLFVAGTGTGVGKTLVTGLLCRFLNQAGSSAVTQKWIQTGATGYSDSDLAVHDRIAGTSDTPGNLQLRMPCIYPLPASPRLAAEQTNSGVDESVLANATAQLVNQYEHVLIEGTGGLMVPVTRDRLMVDIVSELRLPVLLVSSDEVGTLNHTLMSLECLNHRGISCLGILFTETSRSGLDSIFRDDHVKTIDRFSGGRVLGSLPFFESDSEAIAAFSPIGERLMDKLELAGARA